MPDVWAEGYCGDPGIKVGIQDTGFHTDHPDLEITSSDPEVEHWHGTNCAGILAAKADNGLNSAG